MKKQNKNILIWGIIILIICVLIFTLAFFGFKLVKQRENQNNSQVESGEHITGNTEENVFKVNIDINDCLSKDEIKELIDLEEYSDNEMMVYKNDDKANPIEVWKIKVDEEQDVTKLYDILSNRRGKIYDSYSGDSGMQHEILSQKNNILGCGGNVMTFIVSTHLEEVKEQTDNWLQE